MKPQVPSVVLLALATGCATFAPPEPTVQTIDVRVESARPLPLLECTASNDRGRWSFAAPGPVVVQVSREPLHLACEVPGHGIAQARSDRSDPTREGARVGAVLGGGVGVAAGAAALPIMGGGFAALLVLGTAARGAELGGLVGAVGGGVPAYPAVIVVRVEATD